MLSISVKTYSTTHHGSTSAGMNLVQSVLYESCWCWDLDRVESLPFWKSTFHFEDEDDGLVDEYVKEVISWFTNATQVTLVTEYELDTTIDVETLVLMNLAGIEQANQLAKSICEAGSFSYHSSQEWVERLEMETNEMKVSLMEAIDIDTAMATQIPFDRKIIMTFGRKLDFQDVKWWCQTKQYRRAACLSFDRFARCEPLFYMVRVYERVEDLIRVHRWKRGGGDYDFFKEIKVYYNDYELDPEEMVFDIGNVEDGDRRLVVYD